MAALAAITASLILHTFCRAEPLISSSPVQAVQAVFTAVGDIRLDGPKTSLADVSDLLIKGDILFGNLECPITERGTKTLKTWNFRAKPRSLKKLRLAGFDALNLANNHVYDYGREGFLDTLRHVKKAKFTIIGAGKNRAEAEAAHIFSVNGLRLGVMGFTSTHPRQAWAKASRPGVAYSDFDRLALAIGAAKKKCDALVVSFHGGTELAEMPNEIQRGFGRAAIDAGADIVIGHHPHKLQPVEVYKGKPILYSIGNFLFVSPSTGTNLSVIAKTVLTERGVERVEFEPVDISWGSLRRAGPSDAHSIFEALDRLGALTQHPELLKVRGITPADVPPP